MAAPAQSPLRRWKRFLGAFESVNAALEAADPVHSRLESRRARWVDIIERLCDASDDSHAEQLCLLLDDVMAESLEALRLAPAIPALHAATDLAKSVSALREHDSERVRALACGIVAWWRTSVQDDLARSVGALRNHKSERVRALACGIVSGWRASAQDGLAKDATAKKILASDRVLKTAKIVAEPKIMVSPAVRGHRAELCSEEKSEATKRKFHHQGYREADDAKRLRNIQVVEAPEMLKQKRQRSLATCGSSIVNKTSVTGQIRRV
ncbi:unnamed protein product [Alopecurus aequalis]